MKLEANQTKEYTMYINYQMFLKLCTCYLIGDVAFGLTFWKRTIYGGKTKRDELEQLKIVCKIAALHIS